MADEIVHDRQHSTFDDDNADVLAARIVQKYDFLERRAAVVQRLLASDPYSIDAIALNMVAFSTMARARFKNGKSHGRDRQHFRQLLAEYCPSFENRVSLPELFRASRSRFPMEAIEYKIGVHFPVRLDHAVERDPFLGEFNDWLAAHDVSLPPDLYDYDYAGCIFRKYRNAVVHALNVADGREANYFEGERRGQPVFYSRHTKPYGTLIYTPDQYADAVLEMRLGVLPTYLHEMLVEVIGKLREWALTERRDIFVTADEAEHYEWLGGAKLPKRMK